MEFMPTHLSPVEGISALFSFFTSIYCNRNTSEGIK